MKRQILYIPFTLKFLLLLLIGLAFGLGSLFLGIIISTFMKIGFSPTDALLILLASLLGSGINIPIATLSSEIPVVEERYIRGFGVLYRLPVRSVLRKETLLAVNVGGAIIPVLISVYLLAKFPSSIPIASLGILIVASVTYAVAKPIKGVGIATPALLPPLTAALSAIFLTSLLKNPFSYEVEQGLFVTAYTGGVLGTLTGADLLNLSKIKKLGAPVASIGGAGTFDGIFLSGFLALLLI
ncbi:MAG: DUF1614 domain-containing protein [Methanosarcinaceae archaeon]|nr:DUF1614 domain-containing protein [Methanosarcinaceae archaeon]MDD4331086.1 DUF1614 domain-containing protein [Methanosarcinaceae archaeon]MDD4748703.1 DUF1614 domain-containing protein [Methanosarcinaceae archaeon]